MINDAIKMASTFTVLAVLTAVGVQNHWFDGAALAFRTTMAPRGAVLAAPAPVNFSAASLQPAPAPRGGWGVVDLAPDRGAQYHAEMEVNGARLNVLVDTGATFIALSAEDAHALNIDPPRSAYTAAAQTANGLVHSAMIKLPVVRVGSITIYDVDAAVLPPGALAGSLLGMSFLKKLSSFQVADGRFVMKQ